MQGVLYQWLQMGLLNIQFHCQRIFREKFSTLIFWKEMLGGYKEDITNAFMNPSQKSLFC